MRDAKAEHTILVTRNRLTAAIMPIMAAIAERKKVVSIGHSPPSFCLQSLQIFLFVRLNQEQLYVLKALKIRAK